MSHTLERRLAPTPVGTVQPPAEIAERLAGIRSGLHLRYNVKGKLLKTGSYDALGKARDAEYAPRWELWDVDSEGAEYMVMRLRTDDDGFKEPGHWLVEHMQRISRLIDHYSGDLGKMTKALIDDVAEHRETQLAQYSDDFLNWVSKTAGEHAKPKSGAHIPFRGQRLPLGWSP